MIHRYEINAWDLMVGLESPINDKTLDVPLHEKLVVFISSMYNQYDKMRNIKRYWSHLPYGDATIMKNYLNPLKSYKC